MSTLLSEFDQLLGPAIRAVAILLFGLFAAAVVRRVIRSAAAKAPQLLLLQRLGSYLVLAIAAAWALSELGLDLTVLLGAAGVLTVALGFASQTSASNFISGLFLMMERPFVVGDLITVEGTTGEVLSVDFLSVKLRTFDNLYVRIPNETLLKTSVTTLTRFPIRRYDLKMGVAYKEDINHVRNVLVEVADRNPLCLSEPPPLFIFSGFGESSLDFQFSVWAPREKFLDLRNTIHEDIKRAFDAAGIEIPFPHRTLYTGSETDPFPVRIVPDSDAPRAGG